MNEQQHSRVLTDRTRACLTLRLNRPEALNTLNREMVLQLHQALLQAEQDETCRFVILCGAGEKAFCAGGDIKAMALDVQAGRTAQVLQFLEQEYALDLFIHGMTTPVVVLAQGVCMDEWVQTYFAGAETVSSIRDSLRSCSRESDLCRFVFSEFAARSPTSLVLTLQLLRRNQARTMAEVYRSDLQAAEFMLGHHDFLEGVRARLLDKDNQPQWLPDRIEDVDLS